MRDILTTDVVATADGGGKVNAGTRPVVAIDRVCRLVSGLHAKFWRGFHFRRLNVNGLPGVGLFQADDSLFGVVAFDFTQDRIRSMYTVLNPEKLTRIGF